MNHRNMWTLLGLSAMSVALVALPGFSNPKQDPAKAAPPAPNSTEEDFAAQALQTAEFAERMAELKTRVATLASQLQEVNPNVKVEIDDPKIIDDEDDQVFVSSESGWLGVGVSEVSAEKKKELKLPEERGAVLGTVVPESPAAKAGMKENDVVLEINGQRVEGTEQFRRLIHEIPPGRTASLTIWRDGRSQNVKVTIGKPDANNLRVYSGNPKAYAFKMPQLPEMPDLSGLEHLRTFTMVSPGHPLLGIDVESLDGDFGKYFGAPDGEGVLVRGVFNNSPAAKAGMKVGDVITSLDGERIHSTSELREKLLNKHDEKTIKLGLLRNKAELSISVELPQQKQQEEPFDSDRTNI
jgi:serine protease Do